MVSGDLDPLPFWLLLEGRRGDAPALFADSRAFGEAFDPADVASGPWSDPASEGLGITAGFVADGRALHYRLTAREAPRSTAGSKSSADRSTPAGRQPGFSQVHAPGNP